VGSPDSFTGPSESLIITKKNVTPCKDKLQNHTTVATISLSASSKKRETTQNSQKQTIKNHDDFYCLRPKVGM
jgi:hypothetical protein